MSLPYALLTVLTERPSSGSELAARFDKSIGYFWQATHQQIYRELARLEKAGWVEAMPAEEGRGRKRRYRVLPAGRKELVDWMIDPMSAIPVRDELMLRLRAEAIVGPTELISEIEKILLIHQERLSEYISIKSRDFSGEPVEFNGKIRKLVLESGVEFEKGRVSICESAIKILKEKKRVS